MTRYIYHLRFVDIFADNLRVSSISALQGSIIPYCYDTKRPGNLCRVWRDFDSRLQLAACTHWDLIFVCTVLILQVDWAEPIWYNYTWQQREVLPSLNSWGGLFDEIAFSKVRASLAVFTFFSLSLNESRRTIRRYTMRDCLDSCATTCCVGKPSARALAEKLFFVFSFSFLIGIQHRSNNAVYGPARLQLLPVSPWRRDR